MRLATVEDLQRIHTIMEQTNKEIQTETIFVMDDKDFIKAHIDTDGFIVLAEHKDIIVAFLLVRIPKQDTDNLGYDLQMSTEQLHKVAHIESVAVIPKHRGNKLQFKMIKYAEDIIKQRGLHYSLATVSPDNNYSLINFLKHGFRIRRLKQKYSGVQRLILQKKYKIRRKRK